MVHIVCEFPISVCTPLSHGGGNQVKYWDFNKNYLRCVGIYSMIQCFGKSYSYKQYLDDMHIIVPKHYYSYRNQPTCQTLYGR